MQPRSHHSWHFIAITIARVILTLRICWRKFAPAKDVDGFHPYNMGRLAERQPLLRPCTPYGVMKLLASTGNDLTGLHAVVIGASISSAGQWRWNYC